MSTRQKSFFHEQPRRQNYRSYEHVARLNPRQHKAPPQHETPIMPSTETRTKLKAFQFIEGRPTVRNAPTDDKENGPENVKHLSQHVDEGSNDSGRPASQEALLPATPATRLPLADLVGNVDESIQARLPQEISPEDHLFWMPNSSFSATKTPGRRSRKRARSSSPASSRREISTHFSPERQDLSVEPGRKLLRTPQVDPVVDLWNRYVPQASSRETQKAPVQPAFHYLMNEASPRSPGKNAVSSKSRLRRWTSEGNQWSSHHAKRRKTTAAVYKEQIEGIFADHELRTKDTIADRNRPSRVSYLLERMQETLLKQPPVPHDNNDPSSSSPLPDHGALCNDPSQLTSPLQRLAPLAQENGNDKANSDNLQRPPLQDVDLAQEFKQSRRLPSSDFGSEDLTTGMLQTMESAKVGRYSTGSKLRADTEAIGVTGDDMGKSTFAEVPAMLEDVQVEDFFDDLDDEGDQFAADMENVASRYDSRPELAQDQLKPDESTLLQQNAPVLKITDKNISSLDRAGRTRRIVDADDGEDDFGGSEIDDEAFATAEVMATQLHGPTERGRPPSEKQAGALQRYLIIDIVEGEYTSEQGCRLLEKVLLVKEERSKINKAITLRQSWYDTPCTPKSYVHIIGTFSHAGQCIIDDANNMIILHPDHLISTTVVADSFECTRRAVLQDRVKATNAASEPQVYGQILHELFQEAMTANRWDTEWLVGAVEDIVLRHLESIYELNLTVSSAVDALRARFPELQAWARLFVRKKASPEALVKDRSGKEIYMSISKLLDVEEHVWSPKYGLKGNIDATVEVLMNDETGEKRHTVAFEVKTGSDRAGAAHRAQTALYTLLLSDRYDANVVYGILYYMEKSEIFRIPAIRHEIRHMIIQRNKLSCYVRNRLQLPPMLENSHKCKNCYARTPCFIYHKLDEGGYAEKSAAKQQFEEFVKELKPIHGEFFQKWDQLLTKEESEMMRFRRELWTMLSTERERLGRCFASVVLEPDSVQEQIDAKRINRFKYTFVKQKPVPGFSFSESQLAVGEPIVISDEEGHFALANGYVTSIGRRRISVAVDRRLHNARVKQANFDDETNQAFPGIMEVGRSSQDLKARRRAGEEVVYRLDKDEFSNGMATVRNNLIQTMTSEFHARELRALVVEDIPPKFKAAPSAFNLPGTLSQMGLNSDQKAAIDKVMAAEDYALVLGMPGTGKTTTIAHIIRALAAKGKSVLLTSYTHTAVDNILLKIRDDHIDILRLGAISKVHQEVQKFAHLAAEPRTTIEELRDIYTKPQIVATTCLGINHHVFQERIFDYCIVDEASQITLPVCLGPIRMANTFVLVGDHYQLPPLVQNKEAQEGGLDISLFKLLSDKHPESEVSLEHQYRMCEDIMLLSNTLIYDGRLKCGNEAVASRSLSVPDMDGLHRFHTTQSASSKQSSTCKGPGLDTCWISRLLAPIHRVTFANTDPLLPASLEECKGSHITNMVEVHLTTQLVESLLATGVAASDIGIITFYRSQLALLKQSLRSHPEIEMHTADRFQGRDKEVVVLSCVRSNETANVGELLRDWRRVNVAFTRARSKLMILGSRRTLCGNDLLRQFVELVEERGWRYDLPKDAAESHGTLGINSSLTQMSPRKGRTPKSSPKKGSPSKKSPLEATPRRCGSQALYASQGSGKKSKNFGKAPLADAKRISKQPNKAGKVGKDSILGNRPVLRDIVNDALS